MDYYDGITFSGGGVLGIAHIGALSEFNREFGFENLKYYVGTSVGSLIAMTLSAGADMEYIENKLGDLNLERFNDGGGFLTKILRLIFRYGLHKGDYIEEFAGEILSDLNFDPEITFKQFHELTGKDLGVVYVSTKYKHIFYADYETEPNLQIKKAVRWSSSIPIQFKGNFERDDILIDGGHIDNYPIHYLRRKTSNLIGFRLYKNLELEDELNQEELIDYGVPINIKSYIIRLIELLREQALRYHVKEEDWNVTVKINIGKYKTTDFDLNSEDRQILYQSGVTAMKEFIMEKFNNYL